MLDPLLALANPLPLRLNRALALRHRGFPITKATLALGTLGPVRRIGLINCSMMPGELSTIYRPSLLRLVVSSLRRFSRPLDPRRQRRHVTRQRVKHFGHFGLGHAASASVFRSPSSKPLSVRQSGQK